MNANDSEFEKTLETLVRADLDRRADGVDPRPLFERIGATREGTSAADAFPSRVIRFPMAGRVSRWACGAAAAAALIVLAYVFGSHVSPAMASAEDLVRQAKSIQKIPVDRCYLVEVRRDSDVLDETYPMVPPSRLTRLWTCGDRFWIEAVNAQRQAAWGRDEAGDIWIAMGPHWGVKFEPDEVPAWMRLSVDVYGMQLDTLLGEVLQDFDLRRESSTGDTPATDIVVRASLKPGHFHPGLRGARLEFDGESRVIRKLVLERTRLDEPVATVTYTLIDSQTRQDKLFEISGHLEPSAEVFTRQQSQRRHDLVMRLPAATAWPTTQKSPSTRPS